VSNIAAITGPTSHNSPGGVALLLTLTWSLDDPLEPVLLGRFMSRSSGRFGTSSGPTSRISNDMGSENGLDVYKCCERTIKKQKQNKNFITFHFSANYCKHNNVNEK